MGGLPNRDAVLDTTLPSAAPSRYVELDALRGIAATIVVLEHFEDAAWEVKPPWLQNLLLSPLRILVDGHAAVVLFFLLSGFVLTLPFLRPEPPSYFRFLIRRVLRIYVPYVAALMLAVACDALFRNPVHLRGLAALNQLTWPGPIDWRLVGQHVAFLGSYNYWAFNGSFWSLIYEMRISILFPALCLLIARLGVRASILLAALLSVASALLTRSTGESNWFLTLHYAALFALGSLLGRHFESVSRWHARLDRTGRGAFLFSAAVLLLYGGRMRGPAPATEYLADWIIACGVLELMILSVNARWLREFLKTPFLGGLGKISYSLYLVHVTVLLSLLHGLGSAMPLAVLFVLYVVLAFAVAVVFYKLAETPARQAGAKMFRP